MKDQLDTNEDLLDLDGVALDFTELQGNVLKGYTKPRVRYLLLKVNDAKLARVWMGRVSARSPGELPRLTDASDWGDTPPDVLFNLSLTAQGLKALGLPGSELATFPLEFQAGIHASAEKIGDVGPNAPENWDAPFDQPDTLHVIVSLYAETLDQIEGVQKTLLGFRDGSAFTLLGIRDGANFDKAYVHFGYTDNISQPRFRGVHDKDRFPDKQPLCAIGTVLLNFPTVYEDVNWRVPSPKVLGRMGSFDAFRILEQDCKAFEDFLDSAADVLESHPRTLDLLPKGGEKGWKGIRSRRAALREIVAAQMSGRWRNGVPLELSPDTPDPDPKIDKDQWSNFDYGPHAKCPYGAHTRRCNPRGGAIVQRIANNTRRLVRRGVPYGPAYDPKNPDDGIERGLLGNFLCGNLAAQFEAVMCDWLNLGLQDPNITGTNDPLLGANDKEVSYFDLFLSDGERIRLTGLPRLVNVKGGAYTFIPSLPACRYLSTL